LHDIFQTLNFLFGLVQKIPLQLLPFILAFAFLLVAIRWGKKRHLLSKLEASQQLKRFQRLNTPEEKIMYLRRVPPFVFEEMILTALKKNGHKIKRNKKYTGDGGIDGQTIINGRIYLIQAKRYSSYINPAHVQSFAAICRRRGKRGLFVHTGKTGAKSWQIAKKSNLEMISNKRLLKMLTVSHRRSGGPSKKNSALAHKK